MKKIHLILFFLSSVAIYGQKTIYQSESFEELSKDHKILAILPFHVILNLENDNLLSPEEHERLKEQEGYAVQNALETYFLKKKQRKGFTVAFQNIKNTNAILEKHGITFETMDVHTTEDLCKILEVDGIVSGNLIASALISEGVSTSFDLVSFITGKSDYGRIAIKISDGKTNKLLWKYEKTISRKSGKNTYAIIESMMKQATRRFPYDKN